MYRSLVGATLVVFCCAGAWAAPVPLQAVVYTGMSSPLPGVQITFPGNPVMNSAGEIAFTCLLSGPGVNATNQYALLKGTPGSFSLVMRESQTATGTELYFGDGGDAAAPFSNLVLNSGGAVAFRSRLQTVTGGLANSTIDEGVWTGTAGGLALAAREGSLAGSSGRTFARSFQQPALNPAGRMVFAQALDTGSGLFYGSGGASTALGLSGTSLSGYTLGDFGTATPVINSSGQAAVRHTFSNSMDAILGSTGGALSFLVQAGTPVGPASNINCTGFSQPSINNAGTLAFQSNLFGAGISGNGDNTGIVVGKSGSLVLAAQKGQPAPGTTAQYAFSYSTTTDPNVPIGGAGHIAFVAPLAGDGVTTANDSAMIGGLPGNLKMLAREGDQAVGLADGFLWDYFGERHVNSAGIIAFGGRAKNASGQTATGYWASDPDGNTSLVAGTGSLLDVGGQMQTLNFISYTGISSGTEDGLPCPLTDDGHLAILATTTTSQSLIIQATVPEPHAIALIGVSLLAMRRRR